MVAQRCLCVEGQYMPSVRGRKLSILKTGPHNPGLQHAVHVSQLYPILETCDLNSIHDSFSQAAYVATRSIIE